MPGSIPLTLTITVAPLAIHVGQLEVLLVAHTAGLSLASGPIAAGEDLDTAARRHLAEQTRVHNGYLEQLYTFAATNGDTECQAVTVAYYALIPSNDAAAQEMPDAVKPHWAAVNPLPALLFNHAEIIRLAQRRLASKLAYSTIALQLMTTRFTLSELQAVHETILGEPLDKRNFRKRILALDCIEATGEMAQRGGHRPARLYRAKRPGQVDFIK
jgi:8-oxo-dGTP diphosphatase